MRSKILSKIAIIYFLFGVIFAFYYAWYYHWSALSYFSPGFWFVIITWPIQIFGGFLYDILTFGWFGKPI